VLIPQVYADHEVLSAYVAERVTAQLRERPTSLLCLATGATPTRTYQLLAARGASEPDLFAGAWILNLDEWGGLPAGDPGSCSRLLRKTLVDPLGLTDRYVSFASQPPDPAHEATRVAAWLAERGPIDLCLLGLGVNGHIGFNEPANYLQPHAHVVALSAASLAHAMVHAGGAKPAYGLTLGMADLLQSRQILLLVTGAAKREPLAQLLTGHITTQFPASLLHTHGAAALLCDEPAYSRSR
jgi:galactosamine-6-phosphate isomerase